MPGHFADLVEQQRAAARGFEQADAVGDGAGKSAHGKPIALVGAALARRGTAMPKLGNAHS
jgi:hypothetical protein